MTTRSQLPTIIVVWRGASSYNGQEIMLVASCVRDPSQNGKTGPMIQLYSMPVGQVPSKAIYDGADEAVCGSCRHRPRVGGSCYVRVGQPSSGINGIWNSALKRFPDFDALLDALGVAGANVRWGTWGDPAVVPTWCVVRVCAVAPGWTGYTHLWRTCDQSLRAYLMASVDTPEERAEAKAMGWRTFRVRSHDEPLLPGEVVCPASTEWPHKPRQCDDCLLCDGAQREHGKDPVIIAHGDSAKIRRFWMMRQHGVPAERDVRGRVDQLPLLPLD